MALELTDPHDARIEMRYRRHSTFLFRPSHEHPIAPRAHEPWYTVGLDDGAVLYIDREHERIAIAQWEAQSAVSPLREQFLSPWGDVWTRTTWWRQTPLGWVHVM